ncbi:hypothetical protein [Pannonibacter tanglangensis]|uniref:Uncharacterized protein n=1 Tax=Pannonibacter tanglangensis TaxID=2750084 RepID=A0ABW9ZFU9_9HYPH|nr:hypothetical protein [Pannonibacter sp. XCT-34]NBN62923.1 hypothetical protein [Pannonibacter sp. XCT-34]
MRDAPSPGCGRRSPPALDRNRLLRLLARSDLLPADWTDDRPLPRAAVRRLILMLRGERRRLAAGHWSASLARALALETALACGWPRRAPPVRASRRKPGPDKRKGRSGCPERP